MVHAASISHDAYAAAEVNNFLAAFTNSVATGAQSELP